MDRMKRVSRWLLVLGAAAGLALCVLLWVEAGRQSQPATDLLGREAGDSAERPTDAEDATPALQGRSPAPREAPGEPDDYGIEVPHPNERRLLWLKGRGGTGSVRSQHVRQLYEADIREPALVPSLDAIIAAAGPGHDGEADMARVVVMRTEGSRRHLKSLAASAIDSPAGRKLARWDWAAARVDPTTGAALVRAYQLARHGAVADSLAEALSACADRLVDAPDEGRACIEEQLAAARGADRLAWLDVARLLRPVPPGYAGAFGEAWRDAAPEGRVALLALLECGLAWRENEVGTRLARMLVADRGPAWGPDDGRIVEPLGCLGSGEPTALDFLLRWVETPPPRHGRQPALRAIARIGPPAHPLLERLMELGRKAGAGSAVEITKAVLRIGSRAALPYLAERLAEAPANERAVIAAGIAEVQGAETLTALLVEQVRLHNVKALPALVALDPTASDPSTRAAFEAALDPAYPPKLLAKAFEATGALTAMPDGLLETMLQGLLGAPDEARRAAVLAVGDVGRLGKPARRFVDRMLAFSARVETREPFAGQFAAAWLLGEVAGDDPRVRARLFELLERYAAVVLARDGKPTRKDTIMVQAALWGLGGIERPSREQFLTVARLQTWRARNVEGRRSPYLYMGYAARLIAKPSWQRRKRDEDIRLTREPQPAHATWRKPVLRWPL